MLYAGGGLLTRGRVGQQTVLKSECESLTTFTMKKPNKNNNHKGVLGSFTKEKTV